MPLEGVNVEKGMGTWGTGQFCAQMGPACMRAYCCSGGWRSLCTSLDTTAINSFSIAHIDLQGLHFSWYCFLLRLRNEQRRASCTDTPLWLGNYGLRLLGYWARDCGCGNPLVPLGRGGPQDIDSCGLTIAPWRRSYRPSAFDPAIAYSICWRPSASGHLVQLISGQPLAWGN